MTIQALSTDFDRTVDLLGGYRVFGRPVSSRIEMHDLLEQGLSVKAVDALLRALPSAIGSPDVLAQAIGMSLRTWQRRREAEDKPLNTEQSSRVWIFAEVVARAADIFGSREEAVSWMLRPATGLDQRRPIDLIGTAAGRELVDNHLTRLDLGVYA